MKHKFLSLFFVAIVALNVSAQFSGSGSGTEADPYLIFNPIQLDQVRNFVNQDGIYFKMMADIDLTEFIEDNYPSQGWLPIGTSSIPFKGVFDGNGKKISNLSINRPTIDYVGLFAYIYYATITNLNIESTEIKGRNYCAVLCGRHERSKINNIEITGNVVGGDFCGLVAGWSCNNLSSYTISDMQIAGMVKGKNSCGLMLGTTSLSPNIVKNIRLDGTVNGEMYVGGISGGSEEQPILNVTDCTANLKIDGVSYVGGIVGISGKSGVTKTCLNVSIAASGDYVGGICGRCSNGGIDIQQCYVGGDILSSGNCIGGIAGEAISADIDGHGITDDYFVGTIAGNEHVGGVVGKSMARVLWTYSNAIVHGTTNISGIVGYNFGTLKSNVNNSSTIEGISNVGRIYGYTHTSSDIGEIGTSETNKALIATRLIVDGVEQICEDNLQNGQSVSRSLLTYKATYQGIGWDFSSIWTQQETESFPYFQWQTAPPVINKPVSGTTTISGKGVDGALIEVSVGSKKYQTICNGNDWSITTAPLVAGTIIYAIATEDGKWFSYRASERVQYLGTGKSNDPYRIYNAQELANINKDGFYKIMNDIDASSFTPWIPIGKDVAVNANIDGGNFTISGLKINTSDPYSGLIGRTQEVTLKNINLEISSFDGANYAGGLVGFIYDGTIENCHIIGDVQGNDYTGGLVGYVQNTPLIDCSVQGNVLGINYTGGLTGCTNANITNCYVVGNVSGTTPVGGLVGEAQAGEITKSKYAGAVSSTTSNAVVGGLVGNSLVDISECYSEGSATCSVSGAIVGGLVGVSNDAKAVTNCYSLAETSGGQYAGGLVGYNYGSVCNCYAQGSVTSIKYAAGVVGYNDGVNATTSHCFAMNREINATSSTGVGLRVIGGIKNSAPTPEMNNYALKTMPVSINGVAQKIYDDNLHGVAKADEILKQNVTYQSESWNMTTIWGIDEAVTYPYLKCHTKFATITFQNYDGMVLQSSDVMLGITPAYTGETPTKAANVQYTYTFKGWNPIVVPAASDAIYTAEFDSIVNKYLITFRDENGTELKSEEVEYGVMPIAPANPTKESTAQYDYTFAGWTPTITIVTQAATYTSTYTPILREYLVTFLNEDNTVISSKNYKYGETPVVPADPVKQNTAEYTYTFNGWDNAIAQVQGPQTYKATFTATKNSYTITWQDENGSLINQTTVAYGVVPTHAEPTKENTAEYTYTFAGWTPAVVAVTENATYKATFNATKNKYLIIFRDENGTELKSEEVEYGVMPIAPADPTKESTAQYDYTFAGWTPTITIVTQAATYTSTYTPILREYLVTFLNDDNTVISSKNYKYGETPIAPADPVKQNTAEYTYTFNGWDHAIAQVQGPQTYKATFTATKNSYTITWQDENGSLIDQTTVEYGQIPVHANPVKQNTAEYTYTFAGWTPEVVAVTGDATYKATFTATKNSYTITWQDENGSLIDQTTVEYGVVPTHTDPVKQNTAEYTYTFAGWTPAVVAVIGNATYRATFSATKNSYTITWQDENGSLIDQTTVEYGVVPTHTDPVKQNTAEYTYTFAGWTPTVVAVTGNATYRATFSATKNKYLITFRNDDGTVLKSEEVEYGMLPIAPATPTKESTAQYNYEFAGWTPSVTLVSQAATYTATYNSSVREYLVTFLNDNSIISMQSCKYGSYPTIPSTPTKQATAEFSYTFAGWTPNIVAVSGDATYKATFNATKNSYTITWQNENGSLIDQTMVEYGQIPTHADPVKLNTAEYTYTFSGWTPAVVAVTGNATYRATFTATKNSYTITWQDENGSLIDQTTVEYGQIPAHADPTKPATAEFTYTFAGWTPTVVSVTGDATYQATFNATKNSYTITWKQDDGTTIDQTTVEYGVVPTHADPTKPATAEYTYTFASWTPEVIQVTGNATYTATYSITLNKYDITFEVKGDPTRNYTMEDVPYGTLISSLIGQVKEALGGDTFEDEMYIYTYVGLENVESTDIVTADATYYVLYSKTEKPSSLNNVEYTAPARKLYINGVLYIERNGLLFNAQGARVK